MVDWPVFEIEPLTVRATSGLIPLHHNHRYNYILITGKILRLKEPFFCRDTYRCRDTNTGRIMSSDRQAKRLSDYFTGFQRVKRREQGYAFSRRRSPRSLSRRTPKTSSRSPRKRNRKENHGMCSAENDNDEKPASSQARTPVSRPRTPVSESRKRRLSERYGTTTKSEDGAEGQEVFEAVDAVRRPAATLILPVKLRWKVSEEEPPTALPESEPTDRQCKAFEDQLLGKGEKRRLKSIYAQVSASKHASSTWYRFHRFRIRQFSVELW
ncbi:hypothetical protein Y032_0004g2096 [Ancylostoma ceylanicum]|uniref:Uncharacterized protein n=1 Tax=Ancylostoma ceylanicum TaxID=53326 RepID=A0A016VV86_9BILA|nr:hypothetical protein Y032_0004g2096 [Ancylostoma ceylanicum]